MKKIEIDLYEYEDLILPENKSILEKVIERWAYDPIYLYEESEKSVNKLRKHLAEALNVDFKKIGCTLSIDKEVSPVLKLKGLRLRTWILNNLTFLWKKKYIGYLKTKEFVSHNRIESKLDSNRSESRFNGYYSSPQEYKDSTLALP